MGKKKEAMNKTTSRKTETHCRSQIIWFAFSGIAKSTYPIGFILTITVIAQNGWCRVNWCERILRTWFAAFFCSNSILFLLSLSLSIDVFTASYTLHTAMCLCTRCFIYYKCLYRLKKRQICSLLLNAAIDNCTIDWNRRRKTWHTIMFVHTISAKFIFPNCIFPRQNASHIVCIIFDDLQLLSSTCIHWYWIF